MYRSDITRGHVSRTPDPASMEYELSRGCEGAGNPRGRRASDVLTTCVRFGQQQGAVMRLATWASIGMSLTAAFGCSDRRDPTASKRPPDPPIQMNLTAAPGRTERRDSTATERPPDPPIQTKNAASEPPKGLEFLRSVPELRGVSLEMRETEFQELVKSRGLTVRPDRRADRTSYWVSTDSGENVIVMFR